MKYKEGQKVCVSVKTLYEKTEGLASGTIIPDFDENGVMNYWDLYNESMNLDNLLVWMEKHVLLYV